MGSMLRIDGKLLGGAGDRHRVESSYDTTELMPSAHKDRVLLEIGKARPEGYGVEEQNPLPMLYYLFVVPYQNKWFL